MSYLPMLPPGRFELIFTDVSETFLKKAEQRLCHHPEIRFRRLDISQPPSEQHFDGEYDLIIAANVLHAAPLLVPAVKHMHSLLRTGGVCLTVECIKQHLISMDLLFGLIPGWWGYHDSDFRGDYPNPDLTGWTSLFKSTGFEECHLVTSSTQPEHSDCGVFLLRATDQGEETATREEASGHWLMIADDTLQLSGAVAAELQCRGMTSEVVDVNNEQRGWDHLFRLANAKDCRGILHLRESDAWDWSDKRTAQELDDALQTALYDPIDLIKTLAGQEWDSMPLLVFVTLIHLMDAYRVFEPVVVLTQGAFTTSVQYLTYFILLQENNPYKASAAAVLTLIGILILLIPLLIKTWREQKGGV